MRPGLMLVLMCGLVFGTGGGVREASAEELMCDLAEQGTVQVDGLLDDWRDVHGRSAGDGKQGLSFEVRCNYDDNNLYLVVLVQDAQLVRTRGQLAGEDHVEIGLPVGDKVERLAIYPEEGDVKQRLVWSGGKRTPLKGVKAAESRQPEGWSIEVAIPLASLPEWTPGVPLVHVGVAVADSDAKGAARPERFLAMAPLDKGAEALDVIHFATGKASLEALLADLRLGPADIKYDLVGRVIAGNKGRVLVVGKNLAVVGDEYAYVGLPVRSAADIKEVRVVETGEGHDAILVRYVERGGGGMREVLAIYSMGGEGLRRMLGIEVTKATERGDRRLETKVSLVPPKRRGQGVELVVEALPAVGWREADFHEARDEELVPIPLPWSKERRLRFQFTGDSYTRLE